ncbi:FAD-binding and (Fe-S)-binding domain-containing protein [Ferribacterium limneticum]|uniref:FAD-binding and (Fe-S)-binding domain-containing protein n=1 Tax=Ferribacterium limneticum TaxID=76259 RepID=UPI001CFB445D|nr:FAD-binding and (Fe-S)-binding domain-containing protein [Ferribacterium limneticum]UCV26946.1 FAD-binding oxidoreductase [Ferribacterium limneticum]UCV30863.1 FAD-binding oxidoreductase [Ferribacterium limneticum]
MSELIQHLSQHLPPNQIIVDDLRRLAYGTDASFYRLIPQVIAVIENEREAQLVLQTARQNNTPVTFRAAGTSLSGQAITNGILALIGEGFATYEQNADASKVKVGPGIIGGEVNRRLAPHGKKIGPDPASIGAAKIGGIAANNASGMCCGTAQNSYRTLAGLRVMLADGSLLDTEDPLSVDAFTQTHAVMLGELERLGSDTRANAKLAERIRHKFKIKNTTGYSLNALVDYEHPIDILSHLMIGSEGTLGFISRITYNTVVEDPFKASALVFFPDIRTACEAVIRLKPQPVSAVELLDRPALHSVENKPGLPAIMRQLGEDAAALLIEVRAATAEGINEKIAAVHAAMAGIATVEPMQFSTDPATCEMYWKVRKGTFPSVGAMRRTGTTVLIEDIAFPVASLADATLDLQALLRHHGYHEAIIFGHALEGNLHFVFTQDFGDQAEVDRYARLMDDVCDLVVKKYDGSLKAEHGTGRNMAPFVEMEWGKEATDLMRRIKKLFDPDNLLNPGVILNDNPHAHLENLKPMPAAEDIVDRCIECGFCEPLCPSHRLTLSPRQRIVSVRELARRAVAGEPAGPIGEDYAYMGLDTCAGCGLCSTACPVGIDTGDLTRRLRGRKIGETARAVNAWTGENFGTLANASRLGLKVGHAVSGVLGDNFLGRISGGAWKKNMPHAGKAPVVRSTNGDPVVYFPTCGGRIFGPAKSGDSQLGDVIIELLTRAGYAPILPEGFDKLCCGQMLASKGMVEEAEGMSKTLEAALMKASENGKYPVIMDASTCSARMQSHLAGRLKLYDFHEFAHDALLPRLMITKQAEPVALHVNCSVRKTGADGKLRALLKACAGQIIEPAGVTCCGFAGDRGFVVPELNQHALRHIHKALPTNCACGVSTNRTCEIGLTAETGINYQSIAYLLEKCSRPQPTC